MRLKTISQGLLDVAADDCCGIHFLDDKQRLGYREIVARSLRVAALLASRGVVPGDNVPIILGTGSGFMTAFYGAMFAGAIPVPISTPMGFGSPEAFAERVISISRYVGARHLVSSPDLIAGLAPLLVDVVMLSDAELAAAPEDASFVPHRAELDDVAFLQCTSGSTAAPKGVMLTHGNLSANIIQMRDALAFDETDLLVSWLPLNHDMGLIGAVLLPMMLRFDCAVMSPSTFMRRPIAWLRALSELKGTITTAPNFGYSYARARIRDEELAGLDLSSWKTALCGAEPIDCDNLRAFGQRFAAVGMPATAIQPAYGLAEASLAVSFHGRRSFATDTIDRDALAGGEALDAAADASKVQIANCGRPVDGMLVRVVDDDGHALPDGRIGRLLIQGPSVMKGYYNLPEVTAAKLKDGWLDTGDLAYLRDGEIRITGRTQDVIIIRGKKYHPTEFERAAEAIAEVRCSVGFGVQSEEHARDLLYVVCEAEYADEHADDVRNRIADTVAARTGLRPDHVLVTRARKAILKTTSGKVQRQKTKALVLSSAAGNPWKAA